MTGIAKFRDTPEFWSCLGEIIASFFRREWEQVVGGDHEKKYRLDQCVDRVVRGRWCSREVGTEVDLRPGGGGRGGLIFSFVEDFGNLEQREDGKDSLVANNRLDNRTELWEVVGLIL